MLGRLIDQLLPDHVNEPEEARHAAHFRRSHPHLETYDHSSPWGNSLDFLKKSDRILGNLETAATTNNVKWPNKVFNYRMHPANVQCLKRAGIDYVSLANNHTLDFERQGLFDTVKTLEDASIAFAGAGRSVAEAERPGVLKLARKLVSQDESQPDHEIHLYSFSDHPSGWSAVPEFNLLQYGPASRAKLKQLLSKQHQGLSQMPSLKVVSVHWGPNYSWEPDKKIVSLAHFFVDECDVDIIHGHSSHHVQGVEVYKEKLIIYGCGDFVDDYAVTANFRNDLSAAWNVIVGESADRRLEVNRLEVFPNRIKTFQAGLLLPQSRDHAFVCERVRKLSDKLGTTVEKDLGPDGQLVINVKRYRSTM